MNKIYLGKSGLFKRERALAEARKLLLTENLESHPDFLMVEPDGGKISVAQAEKIVDFLSFSSVNADRKVIVIDKAHTGTVEFQQSILKLLEDGAVKADFLLTAQERLLETIHSRCTTVSIEKWRKDEMIAWIAGEQLAVNETALLLAGGRPGVYRELISDTSFLETAERLKSNLVNAPEKAIIQLGALAEGFETIGIERHALLIGFMEESLLEMVLAEHQLSVEQLLDAISECSEERASLGKRGYGKVEMFRFYRGLHSILSGGVLTKNRGKRACQQNRD